MKYNVEIPDDLAKELKVIARKVGFTSVVDMYVNYSREVILAARADAAANKARSEVVANSNDLDRLIPQRSESK